jgi:putative ABC transport system permease protein
MTRRLYQLFLFTLPGWFREEFGREMTQAFVDSRGARAAHAPGVIALGVRLHLEALRQDAACALRTLRQTPAFTLAAVATLAVGLGPTLVIANFLFQIVLAPLPFPEPDRLVRLFNARPERTQPRVLLSVPDFMDLHARQPVFDAFAAHTGTSVAMVIGGSARQVDGVLVTADLHDVLKIEPRLGRRLLPQDSAPGAAPVIVLGDGLWQNEFGGRTDIVGTTVTVDGAVTTIVGVLPRVMDFPLGTANLWVPLTLDPANGTRGTHYLHGSARLKSGVTIPQAQDALNGIALGLAAAYPDTNAGKTIEVFGLKEQFNGDAPRLLAVLSGAIAAVLLIACLNVASLLTVRASLRGSELAMRTALGATGRRLRRQLLVEHVVLALVGGAVAIPLGLALHRAIVTYQILNLPRTATTFSWEPVAGLLGLVIVIGELLAAIGIRRTTGASASATLLGSVRQTGHRSVVRLRQVLVVAEVAATLVLLATASLMLQSAQRLASVDPGFRTDQVLTFGVVLPQQAYRDAPARRSFVDRVIDGLKALPGVRNAEVAAYAPMGDMRATRRFARTNRPLPPTGQEPMAIDVPVGPDYFSLMGIALVDGRPFADADGPDAPQVMIISESMAQTHFPGERAVGQQIRFYSSRPGGTPPPAREIVGVVRDVRQDGVRTAPLPQMYSPYAQTTWGFVSFFVLTVGDAAALSASVQRVVSSVDPERPARDVQTTSAIVSNSTGRHRAITWMLLTLAVLAIVLASVGLYGIVATAASARTRELAIRAAVGAAPRSLLFLISRQALGAAALGVIIGIAASTVATRGLAAFLFEVESGDPTTLATVGAALLAVAALATYVPARRAVTANPAGALKETC